MAALVKYSIPYHYRNNEQWLEHSHPVIDLDHRDSRAAPDWGTKQDPEQILDALRAVRWSPPFQAPLIQKSWDSQHLDSWLGGAKLFQNEFQKENAVFETKMSMGTCVIFDNWRVLHARKGFRGGERWLRGAYIGNLGFEDAILESRLEL